MKQSIVAALVPSLGIVALASLTSQAVAGGGDYYLSSPAAGAIWKVDKDTLQDGPFASGTLIPHYGTFAKDGTLYMPDRGWPAMLRISPSGTITALSAGGYFVKPVTCIPSLDGKALVVSDGGADLILRVDLATGAQSVMFDNTSANGLLSSPDGLAYDDAGNLYVANLTNDTVVKVEPNGHTTVFAGSPNIQQPGGLAIDGAGNLFVANYGASNLWRFDLATGEGQLFAYDTTKMSSPNDIKLSRSGGIITSTRNSNVDRIDALGNIVVEYHNAALGEIVGVSAPEDATPCSGRFTYELSGIPGSGGFTPKLRSIYSPCPGQWVGMEFKDFPGGAPTFLFIGLAPGDVKVAGAHLFIDPAAPFWVISFPMTGVGPGNGDLVLQFTVPDMPGISGLNLYYHAIAADVGGVNGAVWSNRMHEVIGN